jgi:hypothetical protein
MQSLEPETHSPCCELDHIGGDGTGIGISMNEVLTLQPIWQPSNLLSKQPIAWGRLDRCAVPSPGKLNTKQRQGIAACKKFCKQLLTDHLFRSENRSKLIEHRSFIPDPIYAEMTRWLGNMNEESVEWVVLRRLLKACFTDECVLGMVNKIMATTLPDALAHVNPSLPSVASPEQRKHVWNILYEVKQHGMGDDIAALIRVQVNEASEFKIQGTTWNLLQYLSECLD